MICILFTDTKIPVTVTFPRRLEKYLPRNRDQEPDGNQKRTVSKELGIWKFEKNQNYIN